MTVESPEDRLSMLEDFGIVVEYDGNEFCGILDQTFMSVDLGEGIEAAELVLTVRSSDVSGISEGDEITADGTEYIIRNVEPDGTGITILRLNNE